MIGAGIYVLPAELAPYGWTGIVAWIIGGIAALLIAGVLAGVTAARPQEPGLLAVIGEVLGPMCGCLVGWGAWTSYWCGNAYISLAAARYAAEIAPSLGATPMHQAITASAIIAALTVLNLASLKGSGWFQVGTTVLKLIPVGIVLAILADLFAQAGTSFGVPSPAALVPQAAFIPASLFTAVSLTFVAYEGFESASVASQRVRDPARNVPRATRVGVILAGLVFLIVCAGIDLQTPLADLHASPAPVAMFVARHLGPGAGHLVAAFAVISAVGGLNTWVMLQSEIPLGLARAGLLPAWFGKTNRHDIASAPLLIGSGLTIVLLLIGGWGTGTGVMNFLIELTAVSSLWIYVFACLAAIVLGVMRVRAGVSLLVLAGILWGSGVQVVLLGTALLVAALPFYWFATRNRADALASVS
jgi:APA family basic amino acid/polyamine antiporter